MIGRSSSISKNAAIHTPAHPLRAHNNTCAGGGGRRSGTERKKNTQTEENKKADIHTHARAGYHARQQRNRTLREVPHPTSHTHNTTRAPRGTDRNRQANNKSGEKAATQTTPSSRCIKCVTRGDRLHRHMHNEQVDQHTRKTGGGGGREAEDSNRCYENKGVEAETCRLYGVFSFRLSFHGGRGGSRRLPLISIRLEEEQMRGCALRR